MDIQNFYTDQLVGVNEMMALQTVNKALFTRVGKYIGMAGPAQGMDVTANSPNALNVLVSSGFALLGDGVMADLPSQATVNCAVDYAAASTDVSVNGQYKWLSIFAVYAQVDDTPVTRPDAVVINYATHDRVSLVVYQSAQGLNPTRPSLSVAGATAVLLADVKRSYGVTTIAASAIDTSRVKRAMSCGDLQVHLDSGYPACPLGGFLVTPGWFAPTYSGHNYVKAQGQVIPATDVDPAFPGCTTQDSGLFWSSRTVNCDIRSYSRFVANSDASVILAVSWSFAASASLILRSTDNGATWASSSLPNATLGGKTYGVWSGTHFVVWNSADGKYWRSTTGAPGSWTYYASGGPVWEFAVSNDAGAILVFNPGLGQGLWSSTDHGVSWAAATVPASTSGTTGKFAITYDRTNSRWIALVQNNTGAAVELFTSTNAGASWNNLVVATGNTAPYINLKKALAVNGSTYVADVFITHVNNKLYAWISYSNGYGGAFAMSSDGGSTWQTVGDWTNSTGNISAYWNPQSTLCLPVGSYPFMGAYHPVSKNLLITATNASSQHTLCAINTEKDYVTYGKSTYVDWAVDASASNARVFIWNGTKLIGMARSLTAGTSWSLTESLVPNGYSAFDYVMPDIIIQSGTTSLVSAAFWYRVK